MKHHNQDVWIGIEDKTNDPQLKERAGQEFFELPVAKTLASEEEMDVLSTTRRDFLKYVGFGIGAATIAASCEIPVKRALPYVTKPDAIVPGVASYYASSFVNGGDYCAVLVKTREGRPIKIEGNPSSSVTMGGTSARAQAMVLSLYDTTRFQAPLAKAGDKFERTTWADLDKAVMGALSADSRIRIVSPTVLSPTAKRVLGEFAAKYPNTVHVQYDAMSYHGILEANAQSFGQRVLPDYHFDKADMVLSFNADFLGTWISPVEYAAKFVKTRRIKDVKSAKMSRHIQVENHMSLTGSNADHRILVKPSEQGAAILALYNELSGNAGKTLPLNEKAAAAIKVAAKQLREHAGHALVVSGSNDVNEQILVNKINELLGSYGNTITFAHASLQRQGSDAAVQGLLKDMQAGQVDALFVMGANPAFDLANAAAFKEAMAKVKTKVALSYAQDETTALCDFVAPVHHGLESWGDAEAKRGMYSMVQPTISPIFNTRQAEHSLLVWSANEALDAASEQPYFDYLKKNWEQNMFPKQNRFSTFRAFWDDTLHNGVFELASSGDASYTVAADVNAAANAIAAPLSAELEVNFYETVNMGAGEYANNPWLQEMPDPVTRCVWGNYLSVPIAFDGVNDYTSFNGLKDGDKATLTVNGQEFECTVIRQFGQMPGTVSIGLGYGREVVGFAGQNVGLNFNPVLALKGDSPRYAAEATLSAKTGKDEEFACVQYHHTMGVTGFGEEEQAEINVDEKVLGYKGYQGSLTKRTIIRQANLSEIKTFADDLVHEREHHQHLNAQSLYPSYDYYYGQGHHWGMYIDLNACTGCGACTVACMAENNVPVVGKREVHRHHEMTWLRIDRYYYGDVNNPSVVYQPMMCQHCDNAPCENVCPVAATNHSSEGLNQMTYNRCIGTRYCANNCPFKVRRFNWLDYTTADLFPVNEPKLTDSPDETIPFGADNLTRMVLNPDVTVRSRGVIEKCSFCVQRIQEGKLTAKREQRALRDSDVKTACQTACPTGAIIFGDRNNKEGALAKEWHSELNYIVLEEVNLQSSVLYSAKIRNRDTALDA